MLISLLASLSVFNKDQIASLDNLSRWAFLLTCAGAGDEEAGPAAIRRRRSGEVMIAAITLGLVLGASKLVKL